MTRIPVQVLAPITHRRSIARHILLGQGPAPAGPLLGPSPSDRVRHPPVMMGSWRWPPTENPPREPPLTRTPLTRIPPVLLLSGPSRPSLRSWGPSSPGATAEMTQPGCSPRLPGGSGNRRHLPECGLSDLVDGGVDALDRDNRLHRVDDTEVRDGRDVHTDVVPGDDALGLDRHGDDPQ